MVCVGFYMVLYVYGFIWFYIAFVCLRIGVCTRASFGESQGRSFDRVAVWDAFLRHSGVPHGLGSPLAQSSR